MENSINFIHTDDLIKSSTDGVLFLKTSSNWKKINNELFKSEKKLPTNELGKDGDFYAKYYRKFNYFLYAEDFSQKVWNKTECNTNIEPTIYFPYNNATKLTATKNKSEHSLSYLFYNDLRTTYTFSLYVRKNEIQNISLSLSDQDEKYGVQIKVNLINNLFKVETYGDKSDINVSDGNIKVLNDNVVRIWVTAQFKSTLILNASIKLLDINQNKIFEPENETIGLFINGAQLVQSAKPEDYILSNGKYATALVLQDLYNKVKGVWKIVKNTVFYLNEEPTDTFGNIGDICCIDSIITLKPFILVGTSETVNKWKRPVGTVFYNKNNGKWYVKSAKGDYSLEFVNPKPNYSGAAMAITLNQQTYQTYNRYGHVSHQIGLNSGGCYNFWNQNIRHSKI